MKKSTFLKLAFSFIAMLMFAGVFAQNPPSPYVSYDANLTVPTNIEYVTLKSVGSTVLGYYALPDPLYHPNYVASGTLTAGFVWDWTVPAGVAAAKPAGANYVQLTYSTLGAKAITVAEHSPVGCVDATPTLMNAMVIAPPTAAATINPGVLWSEITANQSYQICAAQLAQQVTVTFNEAVPDNLAGYSFAIAYKVETINGADAVTSTVTANAIIEDFTPVTGDRLKTGQVGTLPAAAFATATPAFTFTFNTPALAIENFGGNPARTKYTYTLVRTGAIGSTGFTSAISEKSDYIAGVTEYYPFTVGQDVVSFIVNPTPSTGPIYHVPNNYAY